MPSSGFPEPSYIKTHIQNIVIAVVISFAIFMMALISIAYHRHRRHRFNSRGQYDPVDTNAHSLLAHWEDLPQTPTSARGKYNRPGKYRFVPYHTSRSSDMEATENLLRSTHSLSSTFPPSTRLASSPSVTTCDHSVVELQSSGGKRVQRF